MFKARFVTLSILMASVATPAMAQFDFGFPEKTAGATGEVERHTNETGHQGQVYDLQDNLDAGEGRTFHTKSQGARDINGPLLYGGGFGNSGAASSAPIPGTFFAPGNFALRQQGKLSLPPTRLDSFVKESGMNDRIYGDEGTRGAPPYESFTSDMRIERGLNSGLSTGHRSGLPEAWGFPR